MSGSGRGAAPRRALGGLQRAGDSVPAPRAIVPAGSWSAPAPPLACARPWRSIVWRSLWPPAARPNATGSGSPAAPRSLPMLPAAAGQRAALPHVAVFVAPPCCVSRGRNRSLTARFIHCASVDLAAQMNPSPGSRLASCVGVRSLSAATDCWMCLSHFGALNRWRMTTDESSMIALASDSGSCEAISNETP